MVVLVSAEALRSPVMTNAEEGPVVEEEFWEAGRESCSAALTTSITWVDQNKPSTVLYSNLCFFFLLLKKVLQA